MARDLDESEKSIKEYSRLQSQVTGFKSLPKGLLPTEELHVTEENPKAKQENTTMTSIIGRADKYEDSITLITVEKELHRINKESSTHGITVFGIAHSLKTEQEAIHMLRESLKGFLSAKPCPGRTCSYAHKIVKEVVEGTDKLLASIHKSVSCQSEALQTSYDKLNKHINQTLSFIRSQCTLDDILHENGINDNNLENTANTASTQNEESTVEPNGTDEQLKDTSEDSKLLKKVQKLEQQLKNRGTEFECLKIEKDQKILELRESSSKLQTELDTYERKTADMQTQLATLKSENDNLRKTNERFARLENLTNRVQLHYDVKGELMFKVVDELKSLLVQQMGIQRRELMFIHCSSVNDVEPDIPLMVLCVNSSTLSTDVKRIIPSLNASNRVALLILHHKESHALPHQASERVLGSVDVPSLQGIFDLAFLKEKGLYQCNMNEEAIDGIVNFIKTYR